MKQYKLVLLVLAALFALCVQTTVSSFQPSSKVLLSGKENEGGSAKT